MQPAHTDPMNRNELKNDSYHDLGKLKGNIGSQNYPLPAGSDPADFNAAALAFIDALK